LPLFGYLLQNGVQVIGNPMSSISSASSSTNHLNRLELQRFPTDVIQRPPGRRHDNIDPPLERMKLRPDCLASIDREHVIFNSLP